jgi:hypothetical protein
MNDLRWKIFLLRLILRHGYANFQSMSLKIRGSRSLEGAVFLWSEESNVIRISPNEFNKRSLYDGGYDDANTR